MPYFYGRDSWRREAVLPWNAEERRALTPAEGIDWLAAARDDALGQAAALRHEVARLRSSCIRTDAV